MSSTSIPYRSGLRDEKAIYDPSSNSIPLPNRQNILSTSLPGSSHLSPFSSPCFHNASASPPASATHTPAESVASLSVQQSVSDYQEQLQFLDLDPFVGADWSSALVSPTDNALISSFPLQSSITGASTNPNANGAGSYMPTSAFNNNSDLPISPETTPQLGTMSPILQRQMGQYFAGVNASAGSKNTTAVHPTVVAPQDLLTKRPSFPSQLTPDATSGGGSGPSSDDEMAQSASGIPMSPRVAVSYWDENNIARPVEPEADIDGLTPHRDKGVEAFPLLDDQVASLKMSDLAPATRQGICPEDRVSDEVEMSLNELAARRKIEEKNDDVRDWINMSAKHHTPNYMLPRVATEPSEGIPTTEIRLGSSTENQIKVDQTYFDPEFGQVTEEDLHMLQTNRNWADPPILSAITKADTARYQPQTSQQAIEKFQRMNDEVGSTISRSATWGTRPQSIAGMSQKEHEEFLKGGLFKKLTISPKAPQFLHSMRRPSVSGILKRTKTDETQNSSEENRTLNVPRSNSWGKKEKKESPNIANAIMSISQTAISQTGTTIHTRKNSVSSTATSPKSPRLGAIRRARSKSDIPKTTSENANYPHLVSLLRRQGGPPIARLPSQNGLEPNDLEPSQPISPIQTAIQVSARASGDDDDDDDDEEPESDLNPKSVEENPFEGIEANMAGFQKHVLRLNPMLQTRNNYLVDRMAYHQMVRYKSLLQNKIKHLAHVENKNCPTGSLCIALGGSANIPENHNDTRDVDGLLMGLGGSDGDMTPYENTINRDTFPQYIPMPPTVMLPAELECQLCFTAKNFKKPSDWTKHVHEDVQPFTCTWERCREPKIFKRKADWVRHENEGHRHLEWWTCDLDGCHHTCYRRDNFLQHLVREHKFPEPKYKTKAQVKKNGKNDQTWQKVEECHHDTTARPQDEPCRFCGKTFPTWKKLTVHLAKHMEQISLPILKLVAAKELEPDTIISPVQDPPPRTFPPTVTMPSAATTSANPIMMPMAQYSLNAGPEGMLGYAAVTPKYTANSYYGQFPSINTQVQPMATGLEVSGPAGQQLYPQPQTPITQYSVTSSPYSSVHADGFLSATTTAAGHETFPAMNGHGIGINSQRINGLGLHTSSSSHLAPGFEYVDPNSELQPPFSSPNYHISSIQDSVSPYSRSPHHDMGTFYAP